MQMNIIKQDLMLHCDLISSRHLSGLERRGSDRLWVHTHPHTHTRSRHTLPFHSLFFIQTSAVSPRAKDIHCGIKWIETAYILTICIIHHCINIHFLKICIIYKRLWVFFSFIINSSIRNVMFSEHLNRCVLIVYFPMWLQSLNN